MLDNCPIKCRGEEYRRKVVQSGRQVQAPRFPRISLPVVRINTPVVKP